MKLQLTREQFDWWLDNIGSPAAPLEWFKRIPAAPRSATGLGFEVAKYLALVLWAALFIWVWFPVFSALFLYEGLSLAPWARSGGKAAPAADPRARSPVGSSRSTNQPTHR